MLFKQLKSMLLGLHGIIKVGDTQMRETVFDYAKCKWLRSNPGNKRCKKLRLGPTTTTTRLLEWSWQIQDFFDSYLAMLE
jgi:hypothetical protein